MVITTGVSSTETGQFTVFGQVKATAAGLAFAAAMLMVTVAVFAEVSEPSDSVTL